MSKPRRISTTELVYDAIVSIHATGQSVTRKRLIESLDLPLSIISDRVKHLVKDEKILATERGVYTPSESYPPARIITASAVYDDSEAIPDRPESKVFSITRLRDATVIVEIYDHVLKLIPSELRCIAQMLQPFASGELGALFVVIDVGDDVIKLSAADGMKIAKMLAPFAFDAYALQMQCRTDSALARLNNKVKALESITSA